MDIKPAPEGEDQVFTGLRFKGFISRKWCKISSIINEHDDSEHGILSKDSGPEKCPQRMVCKRRSSHSWVMYGGRSHVDLSQCVMCHAVYLPHFETLY